MGLAAALLSQARWGTAGACGSVGWPRRMQRRAQWWTEIPSLLLALIVGCSLCLPTLHGQPAGQSAPLRLLVVTGGHSHDASFYQLFEEQPDIQAVIEPHPTAFTKNLIRDFDVIVLYDMVQEHHVPEEQRAKLKAFAEAGKGLLIVHHALVSYQHWDWYGKELAGGRYLLEAREGMPKSLYEHDFSMTITPVADHPIVEGVPPFRIVDETYERMHILPDVKVLLRTDAKGSDDPVAWISTYSESRVVALQLGHDRQAIENPHYRRLFRRALLWAGRRL